MSAAPYCGRGHPYDAANTYIDPAGRRSCRACRAAYSAKMRQLAREAGLLASILGMSPRSVNGFWSRVEMTEECWPWRGHVTSRGYGLFPVRHSYTVHAHRIAFALTYGWVPEGRRFTLDHLCRVRHCVNPEHLEPVTARMNTLRSETSPSAINARKSHCKRGHPFNEANTRRTERGRACRACSRIRRKERKLDV